MTLLWQRILIFIIFMSLAIVFSGCKIEGTDTGNPVAQPEHNTSDSQNGPGTDPQPVPAVPDETVFENICSEDYPCHQAFTETPKTLSAYLMASMCKKLASCHGELSMAGCLFGLVNQAQGENIFSAAPNAEKLETIYDLEKNKEIVPNINEAITCSRQILALSCAESEGAFEVEKDFPFENAGRLLVRPSCEKAFE